VPSTARAIDQIAPARAHFALPEGLCASLLRTPAAGLDPRTGIRSKPFPVSEPLPDGAEFRQGSYSNHAGSRTYKLYVPSGRQGQTLPLVVMLHGCTQSPDDFAAGTRMNTLAEEHGCLIAYPAQAASANPSKCWNWFEAKDQARDRGEPALIAGITRQIMRDYPVDPARVYVAGLSAGGAAAAIMAATYPDLYAAVGVHSGLAPGAAGDMPSAFAAMRNAAAPPHARAGRPARSEQGRVVPTIVFHGDQDRTVHPSNGDRVIAHARAAGPTQLQPTATVQRARVASGRAYRRTLHADANSRPVHEQWVVHGAGHAWAGGSPAGSYTDPQGPDASREMLRFFLEHPHPAPAGHSAH
jgi:poly(hydroxyalkanoate) depolymerase family esterase